MQEKTYRKVLEQAHKGGLEGILDVVAGCLLAAFLLLGCIMFAMGLQDGPFAIFSIVVALTGFIPFALIRAAAEGIRLLKKSNGLVYGGKISEVETKNQYGCGACDAPAFKWGDCPNCGAEIVEDWKK